MRQGTPELLKQLQINPKFRDALPPLTSEELEGLREDIINAGEVYDPIKVWNNTVIDGHNRLSIIRENPDVRWTAVDMEFTDEWDALSWIYGTQLNRRNLTDAQRDYAIGKMHEARKKSRGGQGSNQYTVLQIGNDFLSAKTSTADAIGAEVGLTGRTVRNNAQFSKGVDAIRDISNAAADMVLSEKAKVTKADIMEIPKLTEEEQTEVVNAILQGKDVPDMGKGDRKHKTHKKKKAAEPTVTPEQEEPEKIELTEDEIARVALPRVPGFNYDYELTFEDFQTSILETGRSCAAGMVISIQAQSYIIQTEAQRDEIRNAIDEIIEEFKKVKEVI